MVNQGPNKTGNPNWASRCSMSCRALNQALLCIIAPPSRPRTLHEGRPGLETLHRLPRSATFDLSVCPARLPRALGTLFRTTDGNNHRGASPPDQLVCMWCLCCMCMWELACAMTCKRKGLEIPVCTLDRNKILTCDPGSATQYFLRGLQYSNGQRMCCELRAASCERGGRIRGGGWTARCGTARHGTAMCKHTHMQTWTRTRTHVHVCAPNVLPCKHVDTGASIHKRVDKHKYRCCLQTLGCTWT